MNNKYSCGWLLNDDSVRLWQFIVKKKIVHECVETLNFSSTRNLRIIIQRSKQVGYLEFIV